MPRRRKQMSGQILSGDHRIFESSGKLQSRELWYSYSKKLARINNRPLNFLWLANNELTDILPLLNISANIIIPDHNKNNRIAKKEAISLLNLNNVYIIESIEEAIKLPIVFDVINLDFCSHFGKDTFVTLDKLFNELVLAENTLLFAVFSKSGLKSLLQNRFPNYQRLAGTIPEINWWMDKLFKINNLKASPINSFPFEYTVIGKKANKMFSFGWEISHE